MYLSDFSAMKKSEETPLDDRIIKIGEKLQSLRKAKGYTSYENFAWDNDLPRVQYWRMEKGTNFRFTTFLQILDVHGLTLEQFFKGLK
jgi:hypothetical protein